MFNGVLKSGVGLTAGSDCVVENNSLLLAHVVTSHPPGLPNELEQMRQELPRAWNDAPHILADIQFRTVLASKGLEADFVVLIGLEAGRNGFPANKPVDPLKKVFLPDREVVAFAEEWRLFHGALTRARHRVYQVFDRLPPLRLPDPPHSGSPRRLW